MSFFYISVPYYVGDLQRDPNLENCQCVEEVAPQLVSESVLNE